MPRLAVPVSDACYLMLRCQMIDCQHQVQPHRTMSKITITKITMTTTSALILWMTHLITFPLFSSWSLRVVFDNFIYILAILWFENWYRIWNVFSDCPLHTRSDLKLHTITQLNRLLHVFKLKYTAKPMPSNIDTLTNTEWWAVGQGAVRVCWLLYGNIYKIQSNFWICVCSSLATRMV